MTTREKWLLAGLVMLGFLLPASLVWQSARYGDAEVALRRLLALDETAAADPGQAALLKEARPKIRQALDRGEPEDAFQRIAVLAQVEGTERQEEKPEQPIPLDQLWPPNSPQRAQAQQVLKDFVAKQQAGHELSHAREKLVQVADAVRSGNREHALALFNEASELVRNAPTRPGFEKPNAAVPAQQPVAGQSLPPGEYEALLAPILQRLQGAMAIRSIPPQMLEKMPPAERANMERFVPLAMEVQKAAAAGKDLTVLIQMAPRFEQATQRRNPAELERLIAETIAAVRAAPLRARPPAGAPGAPPPGQPPIAPSAVPPKSPPPTLPPIQPPPHSQQDVEQVLNGFDQMRKLPDDQYQQIRPQLAQMLNGLMRAPGSSPGVSTPQLVGVGDVKRLRLELSPLGALMRVQMGVEDLAAGLKPGGTRVMLNDGGTLKLEGRIKPRKAGLSQLIASPSGRVFTEYVQEGESLLVRVRATRGKEGKPADLVFDLPFRAAGWLWSAGGEPQVVRADDSLFWVPVAGADPKPITLRKGSRGLVFQPGPGASLSYSENRLLLRAPLPPQLGTTEMTLRVSPAAEQK